jgi:hypothetical protein
MSYIWRWGVVLSLTLLSASSGRAASPTSPPTSPPFIHLPQGLADAKGHVGYFAGVAGVEAIDLANGKVLWQTLEAQRPLLIDGDHLLAQAGIKRNRLRILSLDLKRGGECDLESDPIVFPAWVVTGEAPGRSFVGRWRVEHHHLILDWEANAWYIGPTRPTKEEAEAARKHAEGQVFIDLRTGQLDIHPAVKVAPSPAPSLPEQLEQKSLRWQGIVEDKGKVLALEEDEGRQSLVLYSWDRRTKKVEEAKEMLSGERLLVRTTEDESILCLREGNLSPDERTSLMRKKPLAPWLLFSVATGKPVGSIPYEAGMHSFVVLGKRVFYQVPGAMHGTLERGSLQAQTLRVLDLSTGKKLWERPLAGKLIAPPPL